MKEESMILAMIAYAKLLVGLPYVWGGNGPYFDCSGFVQEVLASVGLDPKGDQTAQDLYRSLVLKKWPSKLSTGSILFYGRNRDKINHVAIAIGNDTMIECAGGDSSVTTVQDAVRRGAMVRVRPLRKNFVAILKPIFPKEE